MRIILLCLALAGCQSVKPDASPVPALHQARAIGPAKDDVRVVCWRIEGPADEMKWPALCAPIRAIQMCMETPTAVQCAVAGNPV